MENAPVITLNGRSPYPGVNPEIWERYVKWNSEVYVPLLAKNSIRKGIDTYQIVKKHPLYPFRLHLHHHENLTSFENVRTPQQTAISNDQTSWIQRNVVDFVWAAAYVLIKSFRSKPTYSSVNQDTRIENAPIMHFEASILSPEDQGKYRIWFSEFGCKIFLPLLMNLPGLMGYDWFRWTKRQMRAGEVRDLTYPFSLSVIYFDTISSFENYEKSPEQNAFQQALRSVFPRGLKYDWYVEHELTGSWRK